jgi:hypothetical protein
MLGLAAVPCQWVSAQSQDAGPPPVRNVDNSYRMTGLFSDQAGIYQFIQLQTPSASTGPNHFAGLTLTVTSRRGVVKQFVFENEPATTFAPLCMATDRLFGPTHSDIDYVISEGFLPTDGGTIDFAGIDTWTFGPLPADGHSLLLRDGSVLPTGIVQCLKAAYAIYWPIDPVIEYYNPSLDHYFMSASQPDLDALDSDRIPGWQRTGYSFDARITRYLDEFASPPLSQLVDVCRIYIPPADGSSHFFTASAAECAAALARYPEFLLETTTAFLATLPDPETGACPQNSYPVYRVWNGRADSNHRYTAAIDIRDQMKAGGYIAEGYGPDAVAMCVEGPGNVPALAPLPRRIPR